MCVTGSDQSETLEMLASKGDPSCIVQQYRTLPCLLLLYFRHVFWFNNLHLYRYRSLAISFLLYISPHFPHIFQHTNLSSLEFRHVDFLPKIAVLISFAVCRRSPLWTKERIFILSQDPSILPHIEVIANIPRIESHLPSVAVQTFIS